jgi:hypothetical protein
MVNRTLVPAVAVTLLVLAGSRPAAADQTWYGYQTLIGDAVSDGLIATGAWGPRGVPKIGLATYLLVAPVIHIAHGEPTRAAGSLGMRVGLLGLGAIIGRGACTDHYSKTEDGDCLAEIFVGAIVGAVAAEALDAALLAYADKKATPVMLQLGGSF